MKVSGRMFEITKNITVDFAFRDEKVNIWAMTHGASFLKNGSLIMLCKKAMLPKGRVGPFLLTPKKTLGYVLSDEGEVFERGISSKEFPLKFIAFIDSYIKIKINKEVFNTLNSKGFFSMWNSKSPIKYFNGKATGYLVLFRVFSIKNQIKDEIINSGSKGRNFYFGIDPVSVTVSKAVMDDNTFLQTKNDLLELLTVNDWLFEVININTDNTIPMKSGKHQEHTFV